MLEFAFGKTQRVGNRARQVHVTMTVVTHLLINLSALRDDGLVYVSDEVRVIHIALVGR